MVPLLCANSHSRFLEDNMTHQLTIDRIRRSFKSIGLVVLIMATATRGQLAAETLRLTPDDDWFETLNGNQLAPGDRIVLEAGVYSDPRRLDLRHRGTENHPIVIEADVGAKVVFQRPDERQNTFILEGCSYLVLKGIEITGGAAGIRVNRLSNHHPHHLVFEGLHIHHIGGVAITCNEPGTEYHHLIFRGNHIHHTSGHGEAFYLGGNNATAIVSDSIIANNYIHDLNGESISQGDGIELKQGSFGNQVVGNVIHDTKYPGITAYGTQGESRNQILGNWIWRTQDHGIQVAADAVIQDNFVAFPKYCGIYSREHQGARPDNLELDGNWIFAAPEAAIRVTGAEVGRSHAGSIAIRNNRLVATRDRLSVRVDGNYEIAFSRNVGIGQVSGNVQSSSQSEWQVIDRLNLPDTPSLDADHPAIGFVDFDEIFRTVQRWYDESVRSNR